MDSLCYNSFLWDLNATWYTDYPNFTDCFQRTVLVWIPCVLLWILAPLQGYYAVTNKSRYIPWNLFNKTKVVLTLFLVIITCVDVAYMFSSRSHIDLAYLITPLVKMFTFAIVISMVMNNRKSGIRSSGILFLFWFLLFLCGIPKYVFEMTEGKFQHFFLSVTYTIYMIMVLAMLILECFSDAKPLMTYYPQPENVCPEINSSFISRLTFYWFDPFVYKGYKKPLDFEDLWNLSYENTSAYIVPVFEKFWKRMPTSKPASSDAEINSDVHMKEMNKNGKLINGGESIVSVDFKGNTGGQHDNSVVMPILRAFASSFGLAVFLKLLVDLLTFASPQILRLLIRYVEGDEPSWRGYFYAQILFYLSVLQTLLLSQYFHQMYLVGMRMRTALISTIFRKALCISNVVRRDFTLGEIVNLMSVDTQRFADLTAYINMLWSAPLQIILALGFLWQILGLSVLAGLTVMIILIPVNAYIASKMRSLQIVQMKNKDNRIKLMNEILSGVKVLKLYAWEPSFEKQIQHIRDKEIRILKIQAYLSAATSFIWACAPFLVSLVTFGVYVLSDEKHILDAETAFVSLSLFNILRFPLSMLPMLISNMVQASVSIKRMNKFLNSPELNPDSVSHEEKEKDPLVIENGVFKWSDDDATPILNNINVRIKSRSLVAVVGSVGSGKSSLISAFLGEMHKVKGYVNTKGSIAYVPQQAWIQNATLRSNITFGDALTQSIYDKVLDGCALRHDLEILPGGDLTEIGEKGINLSGGQKQRISLARAVYSGADVYFLDDPLSAVDSHVGKHIFEHIIGPSGMLKKKTRLLVTHNITYLSETDLIIVLKHGVISEMGSYRELLDKKGDFAEFLLTYLEEDKHVDHEELNKLKELLEVAPELGEILTRQISKASAAESLESIDSAKQKEEETAYTLRPKPVIAGQKLIEEEKRETGNIKWPVYVYYLSSVGLFLTLSTVIMNLLYQSFSIMSSMCLSTWSSDTKAVVNGTQDAGKRDLYLSVYALLGFGQAIATIFGALSLFLGVLNASNTLHFLILKRVLRWPMVLFDVTPLGRIITRFSYDVDVLDNTLGQNLRHLMNTVGTVIATVFIISYSTPIFLTVILPIGILYYFIQRFYVATSRQLKRLESVSRSPIYSHFGETVAGVQSIRAYGLQKKFIAESEKRVDFNQMSYYPGIVSNRWLSVRLETIGNLIIFFAALFAVLGSDSLTPGLVGLSISYALQITQTLNWLVRMASDVETNIVAVERIKEYSESPQEAPWIIPTKGVPSMWPNKGDIIFQDYKLRYREGLDLVLKGVTFTINGGEKVGIVGRTGAGKSSLTLALFRIVEAAGGKIIIDGVDISTIGLHALRSRLTIIPQDPTLFSGTLRMNLDPLEEHSDDSIWHALELSHLKVHVSTLPLGLQHEVTEGGENFSAGQRQLICLARALLRKTKILVLDEATAAVDLETDDFIQSTIRREFSDCTILTIAHRLNTIMDYDRIIVMDGGKMVEFDAPTVLLKSKGSTFYSMAADAGLV